MTKTMKINELVSKLKEHDGESTVKVWSKRADKAYPISHLFIGSINEEDFVYIKIDDGNLVDWSKIWHDASEEPQDDLVIIYQDKHGNCWFITKRDIVIIYINWECFATNVRCWAYISDLLPKQFGNSEQLKGGEL